MRTPYIVGLIVALAVVVAGYAVWRNSNSGSFVKNFRSYDAGIEFTYPEYYTLDKQTESSEEGKEWHVFVLTEQVDTPLPENGEGPPSIIIIAFDNTANQSIEQWVRTSSSSNFQLADGTLASTTIDGKDALEYRYTGLYENDAAVTATNGKIYFFGSGWVTQNDQIRQDFKDILDTVNFIK